MFSWFDTHVHLNDAKFSDDRDTVVARAISLGVTRMVEIADGPEEWENSRGIAEKHIENMRWAAGLHPYYADQASDSLWTRLAAYASHPQFVAVGEIGLDYAKCPIAPEVQKAAFLSGLQCARDLQKPVIIHCRDAYADLLPLLNSFYGTAALTVRPGVIHCFSGTYEEGMALVRKGFYLGVDGPLTYPKSQALREAFAQFPLDSIVIETDSPYLPPQTHRGQRNEPYQVARIGEKLADIRKQPLEEIQQALWTNSCELFRWSGASSAIF